MRSLLCVAAVSAALGCPSLAYADVLPIFDVNVTFASGDVLTGTVTVMTNFEEVTANLVVENGGVQLAAFTDTESYTPFLGQGFPPQNPTTTGMTFFSGAYPNQDSLQLIVPTGQLPNWQGGTVCLQSSGCTDGLYTEEYLPQSAGGYPPPTIGVGPAVSGTFTREGTTSPVPEPSELLLLGTGVLAAAGGCRARLRR